MDKIKMYISNFKKKKNINPYYDMLYGEMLAFVKAIKISSPFDVMSTLFEFGYVKGYRAALSEMKKGGVTL